MLGRTHCGLLAAGGTGLVMLLLVGALTIGLILSLLALGVFISFRIFSFPDITAEGSVTLGAAVSAVLLVAGVHPLWATAAAFAAGAAVSKRSCPAPGSRPTTRDTRAARHFLPRSCRLPPEAMRQPTAV